MKKLILALMLLMPLVSCSDDKFSAEDTNKQLNGAWVNRGVGNVVMYKYVFTESFTLSTFYNYEGSLVQNLDNVKYTLTSDKITLSSGGSIEYKLQDGILYMTIGGTWTGFARN